ncbi:MAG: cysteine hydrolase family protein [Gammaproteobacteria bacterium]|jgi:nicotinamidase/pyrazinamidase
MAGLVFWDVDTQYDFMYADGKLYVTGAEAIIPNLALLTDHAHNHGIPIVSSADDHVMAHEEISERPDFETTYPPHCMRGTRGQTKIPETALRDPMVIEPDERDPRALRERIARHSGDILLHKHYFDVFTNPNCALVIDTLAPSAIVLYGVALDVCVRHAVDGLLARFPSLALSVVADAVKSLADDDDASLVDAWSSKGVRLIDTATALTLHSENG